MDIKIIVLASGRGSNFEAIAKAIAAKKIPGAKIAALISNNPAAQAIEIANKFRVPTTVVNSAKYKTQGVFDRVTYEKELLVEIEKAKPDLICLAGYRLVLGRELIDHYPKQIMNIHPSLLPRFRGLHAQRQAIEAGEKSTGCTVHWVNHELDAGEIIEQATIPIEPADTEESLSRRLLPVEHETYVRAIQKVVARLISSGSR